jgi:hypothetical protein
MQSRRHEGGNAREDDSSRRGRIADVRRFPRILFNVATLASLLLCGWFVWAEINARRSIKPIMQRYAMRGPILHDRYVNVVVFGVPIPARVAQGVAAILPAFRLLRFVYLRVTTARRRAIV